MQEERGGLGSMDTPETHLDLSKPYTIEFHRGPSDGVVLRSDSEDAAEQQEAITVLVLTQGATVGKGFKGRAPGTSAEHFFRDIRSTPEGPKLVGSPPHAHEYRVTERNEDGDRILARIEYKGVDA
jgi:hypothetical protein